MTCLKSVKPPGQSEQVIIRKFKMILKSFVAEIKHAVQLITMALGESKGVLQEAEFPFIPLLCVQIHDQGDPACWDSEKARLLLS